MGKLANQQKALTALLSTNTVKDAAKESGLSVESIHRYLRDDVFRAEYRKHRSDLMEITLGRLQSATDRAVYTLRKNLDASSPSVSNGAAKIIIDFAVRGLETSEILARLEVLESNADLKS